MGHYKTWTLDSELGHGLDSGLNSELDNWTRFSIIRGQRLLSGKFDSDYPLSLCPLVSHI